MKYKTVYNPSLGLLEAPTRKDYCIMFDYLLWRKHQRNMRGIQWKKDMKNLKDGYLAVLKKI